MIKRILFFAFTFLINAITFSQVFTSNGIKYNITDTTNKKVEVSTNTNFTGVANIPQSVIYNGQNYTVTSIAYGAFMGCTGLTSVIIPNSVTIIDGFTFESCSSLTSVTIPNSITSIGYAAFNNCPSLNSINIPNSVTSIGYAAFASCSSLTSVTIPNSVTFIANSAFAYSGLTSVTIPNSITNLGNYVFAYTNLNSIVIPNSVTSIGYAAFASCSSLTSVSIPSSVTAIGDFAFESCTALGTINCNIVTPLTINANVFMNVNKTSCTLKVPSASLTAYQNALVWKDFLNISGSLATESFNSKKSTISVYPNPASEKISVKSETAISKVELYDLSGKKLKESASKEMNISTIPNGNYLLKISDKNGNTETQKLIKK